MAYFRFRGALLGGASVLGATAALAQDAGGEDLLELDPIIIYGDRSADMSSLI